MNKAVKPIAISIFIYPGAGHIVLKRKVIGGVFIALFTLPLILVIQAILALSQSISEQIVAGAIPMNIVAISNAVRQQLTELYAGPLSTLVYALVTIWLVAIVDTYRITRQEASNK